MLRCPLCSQEFPADSRACPTGCPVSRHCSVICCPRCGYEFPDEAATRRRVERVKQLFRTIFGRSR